MNAINTIFPYKLNNQWMFDDESKGLVREAFVSGADEILEFMSGGQDKMTILFSSNSFPDAHKFIRGEHEGSGDWYYNEAMDMYGWLCPALLMYFDTAPDELYVQFKRN